MSEYRDAVRKDGVTDSFKHWCRDNTSAYERSRYEKHLEAWFERIPRERFCILITEEVSVDLSLLATTLSDFLGVSPDGFDASAFSRRVYAARTSWFPQLTKHLVKLRRILKHHHVEHLVSIGQKLGVERALFRSTPPNISIDEMTRAWLTRYYAPTVRDIERILGRSIPAWHRRLR